MESHTLPVGSRALARPGKLGASAVPVACVLLAFGAALFAFTVTATAHDTIGPAAVRVTLGIQPDALTTLAFPPFGAVSAQTHAGPVSVTLSLDSLDLEELSAVTSAGTPTAEAVESWISGVCGIVVSAALRGALIAVFVAALVAWSVSRSKWLTAIAAGASAVAIAALVALAGATFDTAAFSQARFEGVLTHAPAAFGLVQERLTDIQTLQRQVGSLAEDLAAYYGVSQSFVQGDSLAGTYRVLHVSDLHLDPVGMQLVLELASAYDVELIIDTGDITHFGTVQEAALASAQLGRRPYVFVPGNHDSPAISAALAESGRVTVLDGETTTTARGLIIYGLGDPAGAGSDVEPDSDLAAARGATAARTLHAAMRAGAPAPHVVAVHDPAAGEPFGRIAGLILFGHTHTPELSFVGQTVFLGAGTTGGVHFTELTSDPHIPHGAAVLYFSESEPGRLVAIDQVEVYGKTRQSAIRRTVIDEALVAD